MPKKKTYKQHLERHKKLQKMLDELVGDWITETGELPHNTTMIEFMRWSYLQTVNPSDRLGRFEPPN